MVINLNITNVFIFKDAYIIFRKKRTEQTFHIGVQYEQDTIVERAKAINRTAEILKINSLRFSL